MVNTQKFNVKKFIPSNPGSIHLLGQTRKPSAAKAAVDNFTKCLSVEMALKYGEGIRVNVIAPGFFIGEQNRNLLLREDGSLTQRGTTIVSQTPMKRFGKAEELPGVALWLAGDSSSFVTGIIIHVVGGFSAFSGV